MEMGGKNKLEEGSAGREIERHKERGRGRSLAVLTY